MGLGFPIATYMLIRSAGRQINQIRKERSALDKIAELMFAERKSGILYPTSETSYTTNTIWLESFVSEQIEDHNDAEFPELKRLFASTKYRVVVMPNYRCLDTIINANQSILDEFLMSCDYPIVIAEECLVSIGLSREGKGPYLYEQNVSVIRDHSVALQSYIFNKLNSRGGKKFPNLRVFSKKAGYRNVFGRSLFPFNKKT